MSDKDELHLLHFCNNLMGHFRLTCDLVLDSNPMIFAHKVFDHVAPQISKMSQEKICKIAWLALAKNYIRLPGEPWPANQSKYRLTAIGDVCVGGPGSLIDLNAVTGKDLITRTATQTVMAALFDLLMTERILRDKEALLSCNTAEKAQPVNYRGFWWKLPMRNFVLEYRMKQKAA